MAATPLPAPPSREVVNDALSVSVVPEASDAEATPVEAVAPQDTSEIEAANAEVALLEQVESLWPDVIRYVRAESKMVQALLNSGVRPVDVQGDVVVLEVDSEFLMNRLDQRASRDIVERMLSKCMGQAYRIQCVVKAQQRDNPHTLREQIRINRKDRLIKAAINIFDADIVAVERDEQGE